MVCASHLGKSSTANFGSEVWKRSNGKQAVCSPFHCYFFPEEEVISLSHSYLWFSFSSRQVYVTSSASEMWYLDWPAICRWAAGGAGDLAPTAPSCTRCGKITSEATITAQKTLSPWWRVLDIARQLRRKPQLPGSRMLLLSIRTEMGRQAKKGIMWCNTQLALNAGVWNKLLWRTRIHLSPGKIWWRNCIPPKEGRRGQIWMYFSKFHKDLTIISS